MRSAATVSRTATWVLSHVRRRLLARAGRRGIDLSDLGRLPDSLTWPLRRDGLHPTRRLAELRDAEPVSRLTSVLGMNVWLVTGEAEARAVLSDSVSFSTDIRPMVGRHAQGVEGGLGFTDPPEHTRLRKLLTPEFTAHRLRRLQPRIVEVVEHQLDELEHLAQSDGDRNGVVDLVAGFAFPVPFQVICELLGVPEADRAPFRDLSQARFDVSKGGAAAFGAMTDACRFLMGVTSRQRLDPGDGLIGRILSAHGDDVTDVELNQLVDGVFTGGFETSASMLALAVVALMEDRRTFARLATDQTVVGGVVEELLRHLTVVQVAFPRFPVMPVQVAGRTFMPGDVVVVHLAGANRDPRLRADADRFDVARPSTPHLAFGFGIHRCVGAELARMELSIALPALARRFPELTLAEGSTPHREASLIHGLDSLPVHLWG